MTNKKGAAALQRRDPKEVREIHRGSTLTTILLHPLHKVKQLLCQMLCICMVLLAGLGIGSWIEGMHSIWGAGLITGTSLFLAHSLYQLSEEVKDHEAK